MAVNGSAEDLGYPQPPLRPAVPAVPRTGTSTGTNGTGMRTRGSGTRTVQLCPTQRTNTEKAHARKAITNVMVT